MKDLQDVITQRFARAYLKLKEAKRLKTHGEVASKIGWDASSISTSLKGERTIPILKAITFCKEYGVNQDWLLEGVGEMFVSGKTEHKTKNIESEKQPSGSSEADSDLQYIIKEKDDLLIAKDRVIKALESESRQAQKLIGLYEKRIEELEEQLLIQPNDVKKRLETNEKNKKI